MPRPAAGCWGRLLTPWRKFLGQDVEYVGVDVESAGEFGMDLVKDIVYYDGKTLPFPDQNFDHVLCVEVLEHVPHSPTFLQEIHRVLKPQGELILTVPWSARVHHIPHDYYRFTRYGLIVLLSSAGFDHIEIEERGNDIAAIANKLIFLMIRLFKTKPRLRYLYALPHGACSTTAIAGVSGWRRIFHSFFSFGSKEDPLGYAVTAKKIVSPTWPVKNYMPATVFGLSYLTTP